MTTLVLALTFIGVWFFGGIATMILMYMGDVQIWMILGFASLWSGIGLIASQNEMK